MTTDNTQKLTSNEKQKDDLDFGKFLSKTLSVFFKDAWRVALSDPGQAYHFMNTIKYQQKASRIRSKCNKQGIPVPPILIFSITNKCNLHCKGCYNWALRPSVVSEIDGNKIRSILTEAKELGISFIMIAGGEPLVHPEILDITASFPEITFLLFTNGTLINEEIAGRLAEQKHVIPVLSLEGQEEETDERRGKGIYDRLLKAIDHLEKRHIFWSVSMTVTSVNFNTVTDESFIGELVKRGCKLFFFVEYAPVSEETIKWVITDDQRKQLLTIRDSLRSRYQSLFIAIPGDEEEIGGCLSAGRGFVHINAAGDVEPCPFAPYSDVNLKDMSLKQALQSDFLRKIRENHGRLSEAKGGCALWVERDWVKSLLNTPRQQD